MAKLLPPKKCTIHGCFKAEKATGLCCMHYERMRKTGVTGTTRELYAEDGSAIIFAKAAAVARSNECIPWPYGGLGNGYGVVSLEGVRVLAHRFVCTVVHGPAPNSSSVARHTCGNGHLGCVNGLHLIWGTSKENGGDMIMHGRAPRGIRHGASKLCETDVQSIRSLAGKATLKTIGDKFGISASHAGGIIRRTSWAWLPD